MVIFKKLFSNTKKTAKKNKRKLSELITACEKAYGVSLSVNSMEELSSWLMTRDPYMAELFCET